MMERESNTEEDSDQSRGDGVTSTHARKNGLEWPGFVLFVFLSHATFPNHSTPVDSLVSY